MATTDRLLYISSDGLVRQLGFDPTAADLGGAAGIASSTHAATSKSTPVDADELPIVDSAASWSLKKLTWANLKATLKTYFDTLYLGISATAANASQLLGFTWASPGPIGSTTPNSGAFTTLSATGNATLGNAEATDTHAIKGATTVLTNSASPAMKVTQTGSGNAFVVEDVTSDTTPFLIDGSGRVILGNPTALTGSQLETHGITDAFKFSADAVGQSLRFFKGRGTAAAPWTTIVASGDNIASLDYYGADGAGPILAARITASVDGTPGTNDMPGRLVFSTTADGANVPTERMRIDSSGNVGVGKTPSVRFEVYQASTSDLIVSKTVSDAAASGTSWTYHAIEKSGGYGGAIGGYITQGVGAGIGLFTTSAGVLTERLHIDNNGNVQVITATGGLGYGTGSGGTVTQATSKSTAVTLNKPTGAITMNNAALAAGAFVTFQLTNSVIASTDGVFVYIKNPVSGLANYRVQAGDVGAGYCWISLQNVSAGSLSDAVVIGFSIIKGATA